MPRVSGLVIGTSGRSVPSEKTELNTEFYRRMAMVLSGKQSEHLFDTLDIELNIHALVYCLPSRPKQFSALQEGRFLAMNIFPLFVSHLETCVQLKYDQSTTVRRY